MIQKLVKCDNCGKDRLMTHKQIESIFKKYNLKFCYSCLFNLISQKEIKNYIKETTDFEKIDTGEKAYIIGLLANLYNKDQIIFTEDGEIKFTITNNEIIEQVFATMQNSDNNLEYKSLYVTISDKKNSKYIYNILSSLKFGSIKLEDKYFGDMVLGYIEGGNIGFNQIFNMFGNLVIQSDLSIIIIKSNQLLHNLMLDFTSSQNKLEISDVNMIDFLGILYNNTTIFSKTHYENYIQKCTTINQSDSIIFSKTITDAVIPQKAHGSDSGYDLTILSVETKPNSPVVMGKTGIKAKPPEGYYFLLTARSSIIKTGYILANGVGIIDRGYRGEILVPLLKLYDVTPNRTFPMKIAQLILLPCAHAKVIESENLDKTMRNEGGFGSTEK